MIRRFLASSVLSALLLVPGCASSPTHKNTDGPLTPMPARAHIVDPPDTALAPSVQSYLHRTGMPAASIYEYARIDLDNDGRRDSLVLFTSPYMSWCEIDGCRLAVFRAHNDGFTHLSDIHPVRGPLLVSDSATNGFHDLVLRISGRSDMRAKDVMLRFNGFGYPHNPESQPAIPDEYTQNNVRGLRLFP